MPRGVRLSFCSRGLRLQAEGIIGVDMPFVSRLRSLWTNLVHRARADRELGDEGPALLQTPVDRKTRGGGTRTEARRLAAIELGRVDTIKAQVRDARAGALLTAFSHD